MNKLAEAKTIIQESKLDNWGIVADTFHMNIEETSIIQALLDTGKLIKNIHCLDNNRLGVGMGSMDFKFIFKILKRMNYKGYLTVESCPPKFDPKQIATLAIKNMLEIGRMADFNSWTMDLYKFT